MSKRKLTRRQSWRIAKIQAERSARASKREASTVDQLQEGDLGPEQHGVIITHFGTQVLVEAGGVSKRCYFRTNLGSLRSEEHTSELQSRGHLVCRLLLEKNT